MSRFAFGFVALALVATATTAPADAADLPAPAPAYYPPVVMPPAVYNWSGIYLGGHAGGAVMSDTFNPVTAGTLTGSGTVNPASFIGGAEAGLNWQFSSVVVGVEATWSANTPGGSAQVSVLPSSALSSTDAAVKFTSTPNWFATVTGRLGYAANDLLFYVKGGGAYMHANYVEDGLSSGLAGNGSQTIADSRSGYTVGGGIEYGLTENISAKVEYDFLDFGTKTYNFSGASPSIPATDKAYLNMLVAGINFRFNWAGGGR